VQSITVGDGTTIDPGAILHCGKRGVIVVGPRTYVAHYAVLHTAKADGSIEMGADCSVHPFCVLFGHGGLRIGNKVRIGPHVTTLAASHIYDDPHIPIMKQGSTRIGIVIGDDVLIGAGSIIRDGAVIGNGCVIEPGTVVTGEVPPLAIVSGNPCRITGSRSQRAIV
jgi:acetyltransferase-like isoleucine patch superfamily enzyme